MGTVVSQSQVEANDNDKVHIEFQIEDLVSRLTQMMSPDEDAAVMCNCGPSGPNCCVVD